MYTCFVLKVSPKGPWCVTSVTVYLYASVVVSHTVENVICTKIIELHAYGRYSLRSVVWCVVASMQPLPRAEKGLERRSACTTIEENQSTQKPDISMSGFTCTQNCVAWHVVGWVYLECHSYWPFDPTYIGCKEMFKLKLTTILRRMFLMVEHKLLQYSRQWHLGANSWNNFLNTHHFIPQCATFQSQRIFFSHTMYSEQNWLYRLSVLYKVSSNAWRFSRTETLRW